jgi:PhnB protein
MATITPYLNFDGDAEEAFNFYRSVFGGEFMDGLNRYKDMPDGDKMPDNEKERIMHVALPIGKGSVLMGSDIMPSMGHSLSVGNNYYVAIHPESKEEADKLFNGLSAGGTVTMPLADTFWGAYFGMFNDKFGIQWMVNYQREQ